MFFRYLPISSVETVGPGRQLRGEARAHSLTENITAGELPGKTFAGDPAFADGAQADAVSPSDDLSAVWLPTLFFRVGNNNYAV